VSVDPWYAAAEAAERRTKGETVDAASWRAVRQVLSGLLPTCKARRVGAEEARGTVARAVVSAQEVVIEMLHEYRESTRKARAAKKAELDVWWSEERRRRAIRARVVKGLRAAWRV
tara:strand:- start:290 stop:637 length:348 start_codon:yes stop_codon:yes gene_type:complete